jgi:Bacterial PH domain
VTDGETFRLGPPVVFWWVWLAFVALNVIDYAVQGLPSAHFGAVLGAVLLLVTGLAYTLALRPRVHAGGDGITVVNPYRTHFVPWRRVTAVDTGEWVDVHYEPAADAVTPSSGTPSSARSATLHCWALYVSSRARRRIAVGPPRPRDQLPRGLRSRFRGGASAPSPGPAAGRSRLPEEARYLASLPPAKAMAVRLDGQAARKRASADNSINPSAGVEPGTAAWSWLALAAVVLPALLLIAAAAA